MPKPATPSRPRARSGKGGNAPGVLIDDLAAERNSPPLPPEPVFTIDLVEAEAGKRGRRYAAELEEHASRNARAAAEARRIALEQRSHLEEAARGRLAAEREISKLQRELRTAVAEQHRLAAQRTKPRPAPSAPATPTPAADPPRGGTAKSELTRTRETVEQQQRLLGERREQVVRALRERDEARLEARRASDACDRAERRLSRATEIIQHNAQAETAKIQATTQSTRDAVEHERIAEDRQLEHSLLEGRVLHLTEEVEHLTSQTIELEDALSRQADRADVAEARSAELGVDAETAGIATASARQELTVALAREAVALDAIAETTHRLTALEATAATTAAHTIDLEAQLSATLDERDTTIARVGQLEALVTATADERESARTQLAELERTATRLEADRTLAARHIVELTDRLTELEETAASTTAGRDAASTRAADLEAQLSATVEDREAATARVKQLEALLITAADERERARSELTALESAASAREADGTLAGRQIAELTDRLAQLEASTTTTAAERDAARARVTELETARAAAVDEAPDASAVADVEKLQDQLACAERDAAAAAARVTELTRVAAAAEAERTNIEEARASDRREADAQLERLGNRIAELEDIVPVAAPAPDPTSARSLALEELGQLAASEPVREATPTPVERGAPVPRRSVPVEGNPRGEAVEPGELRRSLLADLSELAHEPVRATDT